jgi:arylsulfatase A-like enzyme
VYFYLDTELQAVRSGRWKLHFPHTYQSVVSPGVDGAAGVRESKDLPLSLFDLDADPGETTNLAAEYPAVVAELTNAATSFDTEVRLNARPAGQR